MRVVLTTVKSAQVKVSNQLISEISRGFLLLIGIEQTDTEVDVMKITDKISKIRTFPDSQDKINLSLKDINGEILAVSQFTLMGSIKKGNRPSFIEAMTYDKAKVLYEYFLKRLRNLGFKTLPGKYGAHMEVSSINDGPFTLILQSKQGILI